MRLRAGSFAVASASWCARAAAGSAPSRTRAAEAVQRTRPGALRRITSLVRGATSRRSRRRGGWTRMGIDVADHGAAATLPSSCTDVARPVAGCAPPGSRTAIAAASARAAVSARAAALPSGRTSLYRRLADYGNEMKALAPPTPISSGPSRSRTTSRLGRPVEGLEITTNPNARDGKPVYLQLGMHHAREWPAGRAHARVGLRADQGATARATRARRSLVDRVRTIIVPVVNPDGFNFSREAGRGGRARRRRHRIQRSSPPSTTARTAPRRLRPDRRRRPQPQLRRPLGRARHQRHADRGDHRGTAPFSEPETQNIRELISRGRWS